MANSTERGAVTTIHLIRHGQSSRLAGDPGLTEAGREQARRTAGILRAAGVTAVYASPLCRAQETAAIIAAELGLAVASDPRLRERANWGDDPQQPLEAFLAMWGRASRERDWAPPVGDSAHAAGARLHDFLRDVIARHPGEQIAAVAHNGVIGDWLIAYYPPDYLATRHPRWSAVGDDVLHYCTITTLACAHSVGDGDDICDVIGLGCDAHLA